MLPCYPPPSVCGWVARQMLNIVGTIFTDEFNVHREWRSWGTAPLTNRNDRNRFGYTRGKPALLEIR